jgi:hypothetical protein
MMHRKVLEFFYLAIYQPFLPMYQPFPGIYRPIPATYQPFRFQGIIDFRHTIHHQLGHL